MCILFLYLDDKPSNNGFKLILAVNRDETYRRPTSSAKFWDTTPNIIGGVDMEPGREGGTWLAMSKTGKVAALLNVLQSRKSLSTAGDRKGRGFLVNDFLRSSDNGMQYMNKLFETSSEYNPFSLLTIEKLVENVPQICYYSCAEKAGPQILPAGTVHGIGNSYINVPFKKVISGREAFANVIKEYNHEAKRDELVAGILMVLRNDEKNHLDPQIYKQASDQPETFLEGISSRFIKLPGYGTRTHTIILVGTQNNVYYQESTLQEPIDENNPTWSTSISQFDLEKEK